MSFLVVCQLDVYPPILLLALVTVLVFELEDVADVAEEPEARDVVELLELDEPSGAIVAALV